MKQTGPECQILTSWSRGKMNAPIIGKKTPLMCWKRKSHAQMYLYIAERDNYSCVRCGAKSINFSLQIIIDGSKPFRCKRPNGMDSFLVLDHIISRRNGGTNDPDNLQLLCDSCNSKKATAEDAKRGHNGMV